MVKIFDNIKKSPSDNYSYRGLKLDNDLMVYLIQNKEAQKSAAALQTHAGSLKDPRDFQGLAHFLEHMLFQGSEKYPGESEYMDFLGKNGGMSNAYTSSYVTNYHFEVKNDKLVQALDMFAQFFISPLFKEDSVLKEINAVNSEAELYLNNDAWRNYGITRLLCDQEAKLSKYNVGNLDTLGGFREFMAARKADKEAREKDKAEGKEVPSEEEIKKKEDENPEIAEKKTKLLSALKDFHKKYYSANQMVLVVYSNAELDELQKEVVEIFSKIENKNIEYESFAEDKNPFPKSTLKKTIKRVPISKGSTLNMVFRFKETDSDKWDKSGDYLSHLIGHESKGSILDLLEEEGLATSLSSGCSSHENYYSDFSITIKLTSKGFQNIPKVVSTVGAYINMLKKEGPQDWVYEETRDVSELNFKYQEASGGTNKCIGLCDTYQTYQDIENILYNPFMRKSFNKETVNFILNELTTENLQLFITSDEFTNTDNFSTDNIYGTKYLVEDLPEDLQKALEGGDLSWSKVEDKIRLPDKNTFIPTKFEFKTSEEASKEPKKIRETESSELFHWQDTQFKLPKAIMTGVIKLDPKVFQASATQTVCLKLWNNLFNKFNRSMAYLAEMARVESQVSISSTGLDVDIKSFDQSLSPYLLKLAETIMEFRKQGFSEQSFADVKEKYKLDLLKYKNQPPFRLAVGVIPTYLTEGQFTVEEKLEALEEISAEAVTQFAKTLFDKIRFIWLVEGNISAEECSGAITAFEEILAKKDNGEPSDILKISEESERKVLQAKKGQTSLLGVDYSVATEKNNAFVRYIELSTKKDLIPESMFLNNWLSSPFFEELRTKQQLGYAVMVLRREIANVNYFAFLIQSDVKTGHFCINRINEFLNAQLKELEEMTEEKFAEIVAGAVTNLKEPWKALSDKFVDDYTEINKRRFEYNIKSQHIARLEALKKEDILAIYKNQILNDAKAFELHVYSPISKEESEKDLADRQKLDSGIKVFEKKADLISQHEYHPCLFK